MKTITKNILKIILLIGIISLTIITPKLVLSDYTVGDSNVYISAYGTDENGNAKGYAINGTTPTVSNGRIAQVQDTSSVWAYCIQRKNTSVQTYATSPYGILYKISIVGRSATVYTGSSDAGWSFQVTSESDLNAKIAYILFGSYSFDDTNGTTYDKIGGR